MGLRKNQGMVRVVLNEVISRRCFAENVHERSKVRAARAVFTQPIKLSFGRVVIDVEVVISQAVPNVN